MLSSALLLYIYNSKQMNHCSMRANENCPDQKIWFDFIQTKSHTRTRETVEVPTHYGDVGM